MAPKTLLLVTYAPSPNLAKLAAGALSAARDQSDARQLIVQSLSAFDAQPADVLAADGLLFGTNENLATMAGISKDFFDRCYYPLLEHKQGLPIAAYVRAGHDGTGTLRQLQTIITGLRWRWVAEPLVLHGAWRDDFVAQVEELSAGLAIGLEQGIF